MKTVYASITVSELANLLDERRERLRFLLSKSLIDPTDDATRSTFLQELSNYDWLCTKLREAEAQPESSTLTSDPRPEEDF